MRFTYLLAIVSLFFSIGCQEIPPIINPVMGPPPDTMVVVEDQRRQVLIEEFTGVTCVQCPGGSAELEALLGLHGEQLIVVSIHAGDFSFPMQNSQYDFRCEEGDQLINYLGPPFGYPSGVVNRKKFDGEFDLQVGKDLWAGYIEQEKAVPPKLRIGIEPNYNAGNREVRVEVTLFVDETIPESDVKISLMITENGVVDLQDSTNGLIEDYTHKHILRDMLTSFQGDDIAADLVAGAVETITFTGTLDTEWNADNCEIIAFVHHTSDKLDVLQAAEVPLVE